MSRRIFTYIVFVPKMFSLQRLNLLLVTLQIGGEKVEFGDGGGGGGASPHLFQIERNKSDVTSRQSR